MMDDDNLDMQEYGFIYASSGINDEKTRIDY